MYIICMYYTTFKHIFLLEKVKRPLQLHKLTISYVEYEMKDYHLMYILGENVQNCNERSRIISNFLTFFIKQKTKEPFSTYILYEIHRCFKLWMNNLLL